MTTVLCGSNASVRFRTDRVRAGGASVGPAALTLYQTYRADHPPAAEIRAGSGAQLRDGRWLQCRRSQVGWEVAVGEVSRLQQRRTSL